MNGVQMAGDNHSAMIRGAGGVATGFYHPIMITTIEAPPGKKVIRTIGMVRGNAVRTRHIGMDILAGLKNIVGGEITEYTKLLAESREQAMDRMAEQALALGANAIVGARFSTSMVMGGAAELLAYGTAVMVEDDTAR